MRTVLVDGIAAALILGATGGIGYSACCRVNSSFGEGSSCSGTSTTVCETGSVSDPKGKTANGVRLAECTLYSSAIPLGRFDCNDDPPEGWEKLPVPPLGDGSCCYVFLPSELAFTQDFYVSRCNGASCGEVIVPP